MKERGAGAQKTPPTFAETVAAVAQGYAALPARR